MREAFSPYHDLELMRSTYFLTGSKLQAFVETGQDIIDTTVYIISGNTCSRNISLMEKHNVHEM